MPGHDAAIAALRIVPEPARTRAVRARGGGGGTGSLRWTARWSCSRVTCALHDHPALSGALDTADCVVPLFVLDSTLTAAICEPHGVPPRLPP